MDVSRYIHDSLDMLAIGACEYDSEHRAIGWNRTFLHFFPEHDGFIEPGEAYAENLKRFYAVRLSADEMPDIARLVAEGIARHDRQTQPFEFLHRGRRLRASSLRAPNGNRVRLWQMIAPAARPETVAESLIPAIEALDFIPDGSTILDGEDRIVAANDAFRLLYDIPADRQIVGLRFEDIVAERWQAISPVGALRASIRNRLRYDGAPFEIELPGERWRRVISRHPMDGLSCFVHSDITMAKRQHIELLKTQDALRKANAELAALAQTDGLTGLANRRGVMDRLSAEIGGAELSLLLIDIDHFKGVNDSHGHLVGDSCLKLVAQILKDVATCSGGLAGRIGGEEFAIVLAGTTLQAAERLGLAIREMLAKTDWRSVHPDFGGVTVSVGISAGVAPHDIDALHACADDALYSAKRQGRDRVVTKDAQGWRAAG